MRSRYDSMIGEGEAYQLRAPSSTPLYDLATDARVIEWRCRCFEGYGFTETDASILAQRRDVDRAHVKRLLDRGATHTQVRDVVL